MEDQRREKDNPFQPISLDERLSRPVPKTRHTAHEPMMMRPGQAVRSHAVLSARRHGFSCPDRTGGSADGPLFFVPAVRFGERIRCAYAARAFCFSELSACGGNSARSAVRAFLSTPLAKPDGRIARRKSS